MLSNKLIILISMTWTVEDWTEVTKDGLGASAVFDIPDVTTTEPCTRLSFSELLDPGERFSFTVLFALTVGEG